MRGRCIRRLILLRLFLIVSYLKPFSPGWNSIVTKFQVPQPGWNLPCNQVLKQKRWSDYQLAIKDTSVWFEKRSSLTWWDSQIGQGRLIISQAAQTLNMINTWHYAVGDCVKPASHIYAADLPGTWPPAQPGTTLRHMWTFIADPQSVPGINRRLACEVELNSTSQASWWWMPGTDYVSAINVHICRSCPRPHRQLCPR